MIILGVIIGLVYTLLVAAILALIFMPLALLAEWIFENLTPWSNLDETVPKFILTIWVIISLAVGMCAGIPTAMIYTVEWGEPECYVTHKIINLADNNEINGRFHGRYVRGYIGEETTYHYYYERYDGGMDLQKANAKNAIIYYTDGEPHADWYRKSRTYWWNTEYEYSCKIYIPEGTMTTEFTIDME